MENKPEEKMSLSQLCDRYYSLEETLDNIDPSTLPPELEASLKELESDRTIAQEEFQQKVDAYLELSKSREAWIKIRSSRIEELKRLIEIDEKLVRNLCSRLMNIIIERDLKQIRTANYNVTVATNGGKLPLIISEDVEVEQFPPEYVSVQKTLKIDKDKIRNDLKAGKKIKFASLGNRGQHLRIK